MTVDKETNEINQAGKWVKLAVGIVTLIALISGGVWTMTTTFAMKPEVVAVKVESEKARQLIAEKSVETFEIFQKAYQNDQRKNNIIYYNRQIEDSRRRERCIREDLNRKPNDQVLRNRLQNELNLQQIYRQKRSKLLGK